MARPQACAARSSAKAPWPRISRLLIWREKTSTSQPIVARSSFSTSGRPGAIPVATRFLILSNCKMYGAQGLQIIGVSMDDEPEPVREFYQQFKINYPVVMGNAKTGELYGGILGLPIAFLIGRDGRINTKHIGATNISVLEAEIVNLLRERPSS